MFAVFSKTTLIERLGLWLALTCLSAPVSAVDNESGYALGPPIAGKFESLTDQIFPTSMHHLSDKLSLTDYYKWKRNLSAKHGIDFALLNQQFSM